MHTLTHPRAGNCTAEPHVDGKRVSTPVIVGPGVASLHPCSMPPQTTDSIVDISVIAALQNAAAEKLASYRNRVAQSCGSLNMQDSV